MMIKKFNEMIEDVLKGPVDIDSFRIDELIKDINGSVDSFNSSKEDLDKVLSELSSYKSKSKNSNDQFDDSYVNLQLSIDLLKQATDKLGDVMKNLSDYNDNGRKELYNK